MGVESELAGDYSSALFKMKKGTKAFMKLSLLIIATISLIITISPIKDKNTLAIIWVVMIVNFIFYMLKEKE